VCENDRRSTALWEGSDLGGLPEQVQGVLTFKKAGDRRETL